MCFPGSGDTFEFNREIVNILKVPPSNQNRTRNAAAFLLWMAAQFPVP